MAKELLKGNVAIAEAAVRAGVEAYFGYPITPQTELLEHMAKRMPELDRVFVQAESEVAAINMVYGAACTGARVMTTSSSPGVSLMMEGISYIAGTEIPMVMVDVMRGGPGLGNIAPSQGDYNQMVRGGGHGDYFPIVLAPASVQEAIDLTVLAFELAEKYRTIAVVLADGSIGQMMEPAELPEMQEVDRQTPDWATNGAKGREKRLLSSIYLQPEDEEKTNLRMLKRWMEIEANEVRFNEYFVDDAEFLVIGFGTAGRVAYSAVRAARAEGIKVGLLRPITLNPLPSERMADLAEKAKAFLVVEMNTGQMLDDVRLAVSGKAPIEFYGRLGGVVPFPDEILEQIRIMAQQPPTDTNGHARQRWFERMAVLD
ncbi:MAG: 3-methyl-2-oxobutanoate dehydrogenase subunit VorB [Chloroflexi bacterium]|nr:MAG: 3-methyl-2-oxobutanoate dehydrogenase subunit VorB [Chloroflexota bacterium]MBL1196793.1 3-methyl-2-oxobutanoate dehydrogenase subunit VorB [Chloroflexota bacterium]NOH14087.1 3-methyl-2-oxobutanoate dehydrogenase subunit VorB [Chloroflexota bacterium]